MKYLIYCLVLTTLFLESCGRKCSNDEPIIEIHPKVLDYFGMYKMGNWWIYENTTKTKKDSVFIGKYDESFTCNNAFIRERFRRFKVHSDMLTSNVEKRFEVYAEKNQIEFFAQIEFKDNKYKLSNDIINPKINQPEVLDSFKLPNLKVYSKVLKIHRGPFENSSSFNGEYSFFAPDVGIIGYTTYNKDTFYLKSFKIN